MQGLPLVFVLNKRMADFLVSVIQENWHLFFYTQTSGADFGLSIQRTRNLCLYNTLLASAKKVYGLYPTSKIGTDSIISICPINALDVLITDDDALEEDLKAIEENGVEILLTV